MDITLVVYIFNTDVQCIDLHLLSYNKSAIIKHCYREIIMWWRNIVYIGYKIHKFNTYYQTTINVCGVLSALLHPWKTHYVKCVGSTEIDYEGHIIRDALMQN